mgnify:FL=1
MMQSGSSFRLVMQRGPTPGKSFELVKDVVTLGRDVSSDIVINDSEVSRHHARFTRQGDTYHLEDLGSTNGTFVNSVRVAGGRALVSKDIVGMGETVTLVYEAVVSESAATVMAPSAGKVTEDTWKTQFDASPAPQVSAAAMPSVPRPQFQSPSPAPSPESTYAGVEPAPARSGSRRGIAIGCGCLTLCLCVSAAAAVVYYIDANNLYCQVAPFLFGCS